MSTPILTKKQQRQSLSAKKGPSRSLRNILAQPSESYWPVINIDQCQTLMALMNKLLPLIKRTTFKIPRSMVRYMSKEKRALVRREALEKETAKSDESVLKSIVIGINAVTRALEKTRVCCILLDANVEPPFLIKHIVVMAQNKKVPILLLPALKTITLQTIGFATAALALKDYVMQSLDHVFHGLYQLIVETYQDYVSSKYLLQHCKSNKESMMHKEEITTSITCDPMTNVFETKKSIFMDVYKYRSSENERAFVPSIVHNDFQISQASPNEFIPLSNNPDFMNDKDYTNILKNKRYVNIQREDISESMKKITTCDKSILIDHNLRKHIGNDTLEKCKDDNVMYLSLKVKRIRGNHNRLKATKCARKKKKL